MKIDFFDFDGVLMDSPTDEDGGRQIYEQKTGAPYPHIGWWSKPETLDLDVFDIQPLYKMEQIARAAMKDPDTMTVLVTNRLPRLERSVRKVLDKHEIVLDEYTFASGKLNKGQRIRQFLDQYPMAEEARFFDDDVKHLRDTREAMQGHPVPIKLFKVVRGEVHQFN